MRLRVAVSGRASVDLPDHAADRLHDPHDIDEALLLADRIVLMTNGPGARVCEIVENTLPRSRTRSDMHTHPNYYPMRNHLVEFLVNRSKRFREEISASSYDPRRPPVVRPGAAPEKPGAAKWA
jgi:nitrate/nitrite transport system ATP-binding protein